MKKKIKVGVLGIRRGMSLTRDMDKERMELVAVCDNDPLTLETRKRQFGAEKVRVEYYSDYDAFLSHEMDGVLIANYLSERVPAVLKALAAGKHVMSECTACMTMAEAVALARAVEKSGKIYMFAENYPFNAHNMEMRRLYEMGAIGVFRYGEAEYIHPVSAEGRASLCSNQNHWRTWLPATYYCTHAMGPIMRITSTRPVSVNGFVVPYDNDDPHQTLSVKRSDVAGIIVCKMDNDAIVRLIQGGLRDHGNGCRILGNRGCMETCRSTGMLRVRRETYDKRSPEDRSFELYKPEFPAFTKDAIKAGHGGGDFFTTYYFAEAIRKNEQPEFDVYKGLDMSVIGILAYRSALQGSIPLEVPDFRREADRKKYENDHWTPDPSKRQEGDPWPSVRGDIQPSKDAVDFFLSYRTKFNEEMRKANETPLL